MCNVFSGHIVVEKGKDWGKVVFLSGVHHEKDREKIKCERLLAWESKTPYCLDEFVFTHDCGQDISMKECDELMKLLVAWGKKQDSNELLRSMITVLKDGKPVSDFEVCDGVVKTGDGCSVVCDFSLNIISGECSTQTAGYKSSQTAGYKSTQTAGYESTQKAGSWSTQTAGDESSQTAGSWSTQKTGSWSTQKAGDWSSQTAGYKSSQTAGDESSQTAGSWSTQKAGDHSTCIIYGDTSYVILDGKNVLLTQIYFEDGVYKRAVLHLDTLFKKYKEGDNLKIVKGKCMGKRVSASKCLKI